jgi:signal transduction histidine kinase
MGRLRDRVRTARAARTIRLRLTLTYGIVFLITGSVLLTIGYLLVRHNLHQRHDFRSEAQKLLGLPAQTTFGHPFSPGSSYIQHEIAAGIRAEDDAALHRLLIEYIIALLAMTGLSVAAGWLLAGRALAPLRAITATARRVSGENLGERIALHGPTDELKELADTMDGMLARLDGAFASQRHFVANASHELRTPLAIMRTEVDVALADPAASAAELRAMGEAVRETIDRSEGLIEALLMLARSEAITHRQQSVDLTELAAVCITDLQARADRAQVDVRIELEPATALGEPHLLERMIANLIDNGIRHNQPGGYLAVATTTSGTVAEVTVRNGGALIDPADAQALTQPFRRLNRSAGGFGLGLSIVRSVAEAHQGTVTVTALTEGGLEVRVLLPADPAARNVGVPRRQRSLTKS